MRIVTAILLLIGLIASCTTNGNRILGISAYQKWLASSENGLQKHKRGKLVDIRASFLPSDMMTYRELAASTGAYSDELFDSVKLHYENTLNFMVALEARETGENLLWYGLTDYASYQARIHELSFRVENFISLKTLNTTHYPVLSHFEGYNEFSNKLVFHVAFAFDQNGHEPIGPTIRLTFDDPYWKTGINHFTFKKEDFDNVPKLVLG